MSERIPTVLIVDDEPLARKALRLDLEGPFRVVGEAANGYEALRMVRELHPDVVLTDLYMPEMGGLELCGRLDADGVQTTTVVVSGASDLETLRQAMSVGAREYLVKPLERASVLACLESALQQRNERNAAEAAAAKRRERAPSAGTWVFTGPKGGGGQTTAVLAFANELLVQGRSVMVVDADLSFGDVAFHLGLPKGIPDLADLLSGDDYLETEVIDRHTVRHGSGLRVLAAPSDLSRTLLVDPARLAPLVEALEERYDYVLVDLPFGMGEDVARLLDRARLVFEVSAGDPARMRHMLAVHEMLGRLGYPAEKLVPVLTRVDPARGQRLLQSARIDHGFCIPDDDEACDASLRHGQPVTRIVPTSSLALAIRDGVATILGLPLPTRSLLPRILQGLLG